MKLKFYRVAAFVLTSLTCVCLSWGGSVEAQDSVIFDSEDKVEATFPPGVNGDKATTTQKQKIPVEQLQLLVNSLTVEELHNEAAGWLILLQKKAKEISLAELAIKNRKEDSKLSDKNQLVLNVANLESQQTAIIERFTVVLDELEEKGGDTFSYRKYIEGVSGFTFNITDTEGIGLRFITWLKSEKGGIKLGIQILNFSSIVLISVLVAPRISKLADTVLSNFDAVSSLFRGYLVMLLKRGTVVIGVLLGLASLGVSLGPILALVGGASFVLAFALQENLGNFASGLMLLINKPFDVGDEVRIDENWAHVDSISLASTRLKDYEGNIITLPNNTVWGSKIINYTHSEHRKVMLNLYIKFEQDIDQVREMWLKVAASHPKILDTPKPRIFPWNSYYDYYINMSLSAWCLTEDYWEVYGDLLKSVQRRMQELGIELAPPPI